MNMTDTSGLSDCENEKKIKKSEYAFKIGIHGSHLVLFL